MKTKNMSGTKIIYLGLNDVEVIEDTSENWWSQGSGLSDWGVSRRYRSGDSNEDRLFKKLRRKVGLGLEASEASVKLLFICLFYK